MATFQSTLMPSLSIAHDDVSGDIISITFDPTDASVSKDFSGKGLLANKDESTLVGFLQEIFETFSGSLTNLDSPIAADTNDDFFDSEGITDRDSGNTDAEGNAITEKQMFQTFKFVIFYKFDPSLIFTSNNAVNDDD